MRGAGTGEVASVGKLEPCTELTCEQCGARFRPRNRNGIRPRFCSAACSRRWHNTQRLRGAAALKAVAVVRVRRSDPRKQRVDLAVIPPLERPALLREAAERLGLTESAAVRAARVARATEICA